MIKVTLIGLGNVSYHLERAFRLTKNIEVVAVLNSRKKISQLKSGETDVCILAVSDDALQEVAGQFENFECLMVHTSGSIAINELPDNFRRGVFYPLQTFSKEKKLDFSDIPICIEAENQKDINLLSRLAGYISKNVQEVSSVQRKSLHMAAVFANNFTNHLYQIAHEICDENDLSFDLLKPLIMETADKIKTLSPFEAQTGPAKRYDLSIVNDHMELLKDSDRKKIYKQLTQSIQKTYGQKL